MNTSRRSNRDVLGNIGLNDQRAHGNRVFNKSFSKPIKKQEGGSVRATALSICLQNQEIKRLKLQNAFLKLKLHNVRGNVSSTDKSTDHTTPKKRRFDGARNDDEIVDRLGSVTTNMFASPTRVKTRDIPTTPPSRAQPVVGSGQKSVPTPDRHVRHAKLHLHEMKPPLPRQHTSTLSNYISDDKIDDLSSRLRELERHIQELTFQQPREGPPVHTPSKAPPNPPRARSHEHAPSLPSNSTPTRSKHKVLFDDEEVCHASPRGADDVHQSTPSVSTASVESPAAPPAATGEGESSATTRHASDANGKKSPAIEEAAHSTDSEADSFHAIIQGASSSALRTMQLSVPDLRHRYEATTDACSTPDATLAAVRKGLSSPPQISPLGKPASGTPTVALSDLPLLQSQLSTWRKRYSTPATHTTIYTRPNLSDHDGNRRSTGG